MKDKEDVVHTHTHTHTEEYYSVIKKKEFCHLLKHWMNLEGVMLSEISQTEKDKYCTISLIHGI